MNPSCAGSVSDERTAGGTSSRRSGSKSSGSLCAATRARGLRSNQRRDDHRALGDHPPQGLLARQFLARHVQEEADARIERVGHVLVHFEDQLTDGKMTFDYRVRPGVVTKSNALELMRAVGLEV